MTASELNRKLLYYGFSDITDYLRNSPLNRYLYKRMLEYKEICGIDTPVVILFNEIYFQCVRVGFDSNPGEDLQRRYIAEERRWLHSDRAAEMVFFFVWVLLRRKRELSFNEECFLDHLNPLVLHSENKEMLKELLMHMQQNDIKVPDHFAPMNYPAVGIPSVAKSEPSTFLKRVSDSLNRIIADDEEPVGTGNCWMDLTENYSYPLVEKYVKLYPDTGSRLIVLDRIEESVPKHLQKKHEEYFKGLRMHIESGQVVYRTIGDDEIGKHDWYEVNTFGVSESLNPYTNELQSLAAQYKQERDEARQQLEEQKKTYDIKIAQLEEQYDKAVNELSETNKAVEAAKTSSQELSLTIGEMAAHVRERFSKSGAEEFIAMYYRLALKHGDLNEETCKAIDDIIPAILRRSVLHQTIEIPQAGQVNISPQNVNNYPKEEL